jgi:hypothetical protein
VASLFLFPCPDAKYVEEDVAAIFKRENRTTRSHHLQTHPKTMSTIASSLGLDDNTTGDCAFLKAMKEELTTLIKEEMKGLEDRLKKELGTKLTTCVVDLGNIKKSLGTIAPTSGTSSLMASHPSSLSSSLIHASPTSSVSVNETSDLSETRVSPAFAPFGSPLSGSQTFAEVCLLCPNFILFYFFVLLKKLYFVFCCVIFQVAKNKDDELNLIARRHFYNFRPDPHSSLYVHSYGVSA